MKFIGFGNFRDKNGLLIFIIWELKSSNLSILNSNI
jgi:hypothetical protein